MTVRELNKNQLEELRESYFYQLLDTNAEVLGDINDPSDIPDDIIFNHYDGIMFVEDDFFCSINN